MKFYDAIRNGLSRAFGFDEGRGSLVKNEQWIWRFRGVKFWSCHSVRILTSERGGIGAKVSLSDLLSFNAQAKDHKVAFDVIELRDLGEMAPFLEAMGLENSEAGVVVAEDEGEERADVKAWTGLDHLLK